MLKKTPAVKKQAMDQGNKFFLFYTNSYKGSRKRKLQLRRKKR
jgi:hypothetical protein